MLNAEHVRRIVVPEGNHVPLRLNNVGNAVGEARHGLVVVAERGDLRVVRHPTHARAIAGTWGRVFFLNE